MTDTGYQPRVVLYVRTLSPNGATRRQREVIDSLQSLAEHGHITDVTVEVWGQRVPREGGTKASGAILDRLDEFESWSERAGTSLSVTFRETKSESLLTSDAREVIVLPVLCLVEYRGETVQYVSPCVDGGEVRTVTDRVEAIGRGRHDIEKATTVNT